MDLFDKPNIPMDVSIAKDHVRLYHKRKEFKGDFCYPFNMILYKAMSGKDKWVFKHLSIKNLGSLREAGFNIKFTNEQQWEISWE